MIDNQQTEAILADHYKRGWLRANRGALAEVARQLSGDGRKCSRQFVRMVFWGERRSARVERALHQLRAAGFERRKAA